MRVEVVADQCDLLRVLKARMLDDRLDLLRPNDRRLTGGDRNVPPAAQWLDEHPTVQHPSCHTHQRCGQAAERSGTGRLNSETYCFG